MDSQTDYERGFGSWQRPSIPQVRPSYIGCTCTSSPREAKEKDWGVCVMNPNLNDIAGESIEGSEEPEEHGKTVWRTMITPAKASKVVVVAHSYGGVVAMHLASTFGEEWVSLYQ